MMGPQNWGLTQSAASVRSHSSLFCPASTTSGYVPFAAGTTSSCAPFVILGHKMANDTKCSQLQDARNSGPTSGTRTGRKQVRSSRRGTSPQSGETGSTRKIPVRVVKLTDAEAIEAQCVELSVVVKSLFVC